MKAVILVDTREKVNQHILTRLDELNISYRLKKLNYGDYSFERNGVSYENKIVIERKGSLDEIIGNFTVGRERFKREFERSKGCKVILMVEATQSQLERHEYRSRMSPKDLKGFLATWSNKFQLELKFVDKSESCDLMLEQFKKFIKDGVKQNE
jgi:ERCC4-type nuclease